MISKQKTSLFWRVVSSNWFLFFVFLALVLASWRLVRLTIKKQSFNQELAHLQQQVGDLKESKEKLAQDLQDQSSSENLEKEARRRLNVKKPGESVVVVLPGEEIEPRQRSILSSGTASNLPVSQIPWWQENLKKWRRYFHL